MKTTIRKLKTPHEQFHFSVKPPGFKGVIHTVDLQDALAAAMGVKSKDGIVPPILLKNQPPVPQDLIELITKLAGVAPVFVPQRGGVRTPGPGKKLGRSNRTHPVRAITITAPVALIEAHDAWRKQHKPKLSRTQALALQCGWKPSTPKKP